MRKQEISGSSFAMMAAHVFLLRLVRVAFVLFALVSSLVVSFLHVLSLSNGWSVSCPRSVLACLILVVCSVCMHEGWAVEG